MMFNEDTLGQIDRKDYAQACELLEHGAAWESLSIRQKRLLGNDEDIAFIEVMHWRDRAKARRLLAENPDTTLSAYQQELLGHEWTDHQRAVVARAKQREEDAEHAAALRIVLCAQDQPSSTLAALAEHAVELCVRHRITAVLNTREGVLGYADPNKRRIAVRPVICERAYATALHEIGHVLDSRRPSGFTAKISGHSYESSPMSELAAWRWAHEHAAMWTRKMHSELADHLARCAELYTKHTDGDGSIGPFVECLRGSAARICDRPLTAHELDVAVSDIAITRVASSRDLSAHLASRVTELLNE